MAAAEQAHGLAGKLLCQQPGTSKAGDGSKPHNSSCPHHPAKQDRAGQPEPPAASWLGPIWSTCLPALSEYCPATAAQKKQLPALPLAEECWAGAALALSSCEVGGEVAHSCPPVQPASHQPARVPHPLSQGTSSSEFCSLPPGVSLLLMYPLLLPGYLPG